MSQTEMTPQMRLFADAYLRTMSLRKAALEAGYSAGWIDGTCQRIKNHPAVKAYLEEQFAERAMSAREVVDRITEIAMCDISEAVMPSGALDMKKVKELGLDRHIKQTGFDSNGNLKVEFYDRHAALRDLGRVHKLFGDSNTISGAGGGPAVVEVRFIDAEVATSAEEVAPE